MFDEVSGEFTWVAFDEVALVDSDEVSDWFAPSSFTVCFDTDTVVFTVVVSFATDFSLVTVTADVDAEDDAFDDETFVVFGASFASAGEATVVWFTGAFTVCSTVGTEVIAAVFTGAVVGVEVVFD